MRIICTAAFQYEGAACEDPQYLAMNQEDSHLSVLCAGELASACIPENRAKALENALHPEIIYKAQEKFNMIGNILSFQSVEQRGT